MNHFNSHSPKLLRRCVGFQSDREISSPFFCHTLFIRVLGKATEEGDDFEKSSEWASFFSRGKRKSGGVLTCDRNARIRLFSSRGKRHEFFWQMLIAQEKRQKGVREGGRVRSPPWKSFERASDGVNPIFAGHRTLICLKFQGVLLALRRFPKKWKWKKWTKHL